MLILEDMNLNLFFYIDNITQFLFLITNLRINKIKFTRY